MKLEGNQQKERKCERRKGRRRRMERVKGGGGKSMRLSFPNNRSRLAGHFRPATLNPLRPLGRFPPIIHLSSSPEPYQLLL